MNLTKKQIKKITRCILAGKLTSPTPTLKRRAKNKSPKRDTQKTICFHCREPIDKRKRNFIEVVKRTKHLYSACAKMCFHMDCWMLAAGEEFEIK